MLSRRGQVPRGHILYDPWPVDAQDVPLGNVLKVWRWLRKRAGQGNWRAAVDAMRPHTSMVWRSWDEEQQGRFMRHARPFWDVHRHRIATEVAERMKQLIGNGQLQIAAGRIQSMRETADGVEVDFCARCSGRVETRTFDTVINCTGPATDYARVEQPLVAQLRSVGWLTPDPLGLGIETEDDGGLIDRNGRRVPGLFAIGPMCRPRLWESTAIPEIRVQAATLAKQFSIDAGRSRQRERIAI